MIQGAGKTVTSMKKILGLTPESDGGLNGYIAENNVGFETSGWTEIDALVFAELSYIPFEKLMEKYPDRDWTDISIKECMQLAQENWGEFQLLWSENKKSLYKMAGLLQESGRFSELRITDIRVVQSSAENTQFAGITIHIPQADGEYLTVAFRGTNGSREGWMEDFMLAYSDETHAQRLSVDYLTEISEAYGKPVYVAGHSKGGNNAMYSFLAASPEVQETVKHIYNFDGPGFRAAVLEKWSDAYPALLDKLDCYIPQTSMIGLLLNDHAVQTHVVSQNELILQHDAFSWKVDEQGFVRNALGTDGTGQFVNGVLDDVVAGMTDEQRETLVQLLDTYGVFSLIAKDPRFLGRQKRVASGVTALYDRREELRGKSWKEANEWCANVCEKAWSDYAKLQENKKDTIKTALTVCSFSLSHRALVAADAACGQFAQWADEQIQFMQTKCSDYEAWMKEHKLAAVCLYSVADVGKHIISTSKEWIHQFFVRTDERINGYTENACQGKALSVDTQVLEECVHRLRKVQNGIYYVDDLLNQCRSGLGQYDSAKIAWKSIDLDLVGAEGIRWLMDLVRQRREDVRVENCICYLNIAKSMLEDAETKLCVSIYDGSAVN